MAFSRSKNILNKKVNCNGELVRQRRNEYSDTVRAKNKREDGLLAIRLKYYEREKNKRLNMIRREQYQLECTRRSLLLQSRKQNLIASSWKPSPQPIFDEQACQLSTPDFNVWACVSTVIQANKISLQTNENLKTMYIRRHSTG